MTHGPRVSVICPTYQHACYVRQALASLESQTLVDWEALVVDDGSTDGTIEIVESFATIDPRIQLLKFAHRGPEALGETYNAALEKARGEYIAILEGDDYWPSDKLSVQLAAMADDRAISYGRVCIVDWTGRTQFVQGLSVSRGAGNNEPTGAAIGQLLSHRNFIPAVSAVVRADALRSVGGFQFFPGMVQVDFCTWAALAVRYRFQYIDHILGYWRRHPGSITTSRFAQMVAGKNAFLRDFTARSDVASLLSSIGICSQDIDAAIRETERRFALAAGAARHTLAARQWALARAMYWESAREVETVSDAVRVIVGLLSSLLQSDFFAVARRAK